MKFSDKKQETICCDNNTSCSDSSCTTSSCNCSSNISTKIACPICGQIGHKVTGITIKAQLKKEKFKGMSHDKDEFNFCSNPSCDNVYYSNDKKQNFTQADIKSKVTIKNNDPKTPLCYCKKLLKKDVIEMINRGEKDIGKKVRDIISQGKTFCEKANPKGSCCTKEVGDFLADYNIAFFKE